MAANKTKLIASAQRYAQKGQHKKAIVEYQKVLRLEPDDIRTKLKLGEMHHRAGATNEACEIFLSVAKSYAEQGFLLKAVAVYKQILKLDPELPDVHILLAQTYQHLGLSDSVNQYHEAAVLLERHGRTLDRLHVIRKMLELDPENIPDRLRLAEAYSAAGQLDEAVSQFRLVCGGLKQRGFVDDFLKVGERLLHHRPNDFDISRDLAQAYLKRDLPQWALSRLQLCFKARPRDTDVLEMLVETFEALGQVHKAIAVLKELGHIYEESGLTREYHEMMGRVLDLNPDDPDAQKALQAVKVVPVKPEIEFDDSEPEHFEPDLPADPDEEPGFASDDEPLPASSQSRPPALRLVKSLGRSDSEPARSAKSPSGDDVEEEGELPFEVDEESLGPVVVRESTSSGIDDADVISSAMLEVDAREPEEVPFESEQWEADIDVGETEVTLVDAPFSLEVSGPEERWSPGLLRIERKGTAKRAESAPNEEGSAEVESDDGEEIEEVELVIEDVDADSEEGESSGQAVADTGEQSASSRAAEIREELRELDFYLEQGFEAEARTLYDELLARFPGHPDLLERATRVRSLADIG